MIELRSKGPVFIFKIVQVRPVVEHAQLSPGIPGQKVHLPLVEAESFQDFSVSQHLIGVRFAFDKTDNIVPLVAMNDGEVEFLCVPHAIDFK